MVFSYEINMFFPLPMKLFRTIANKIHPLYFISNYMCNYKKFFCEMIKPRFRGYKHFLEVCELKSVEIIILKRKNWNNMLFFFKIGDIYL